MARSKGTTNPAGGKQGQGKKKPKEEIDEFDLSVQPRKKGQNSRIGSRNMEATQQTDGHRSRYGYTAMVLLLVAFVSYYAYIGYLETRISTPLAEEKVVNKAGLEIPERFWGNYRPGVYLGMKHRSEVSLVGGLMWLIPSLRDQGMRHSCRQEDNLSKYGWIEHDGTNFGIQEIFDNGFKITTSFVKRTGGNHGGDWSTRISVEPDQSSKISVPAKETSDNKDHDEIILSFYVTLEKGVMGTISPEEDDHPAASSPALHGNTSTLGKFIVRFLSGPGVLESSRLLTKIGSLTDIPNVALNHIVPKRVKGKWIYSLNAESQFKYTGEPNTYIYMIHAKGPITMEIVYESASFHNRHSMLAGPTYDAVLKTYSDEFHKKFENTFHLKSKGFNESGVQFAEAALSNLIGGIGHFYGSSRVQSVHNQAPVPYWPASLYTAVPSRSFFPRGFLWDEGFHLLLVNKWDPEISLDIIAHWLDLMNTEGWIPREQILGKEALSRVPEEYVVQKNDVANPPTLILAFHDLMSMHKEWLLTYHRRTLARIWPRLTAWFHWLSRTQGGQGSAYRWRGRNETTQRELNPKTMASGLDDYPRASRPSDSERHLDLRCWMTLASKAMAELADLLGYDSSKYETSYDALMDQRTLDDLHWSNELKAYADYGLHSDKVVLKDTFGPSSPQGNQGRREKVRVELSPPKYGFVNSFGYVSLFPMLLEILDPKSEKLLMTVNHLNNSRLLWTPYGLRSLAASAPLYNTRNTEHDPPYWRGAIWININFLTLKSLKKYSEAGGSVGPVALNIYKNLRTNIMRNMMSQYKKTGFIWEQFSDLTGEGKGCRPFTGWSSLVVLIMSEEY